MVPTHFSSLFAMGEKRHSFNHRSLKCVIVGTAPLSQAMKVRIVGYIGEGKLFERYGSTEASIVTALRPRDQLRKQRCVGLPLAATQIRILDTNGERCCRRARSAALQHVQLYVLRLPQPARRHGKVDARRMVLGRRPRPARRGGLPLSGRPQERHDHLRRRERLSPRGRGGAARPPGDRSGRGGRPAARALGRAGGRICGDPDPA